jgi:hypothetical protein
MACMNEVIHDRKSAILNTIVYLISLHTRYWGFDHSQGHSSNLRFSCFVGDWRIDRKCARNSPRFSELRLNFETNPLPINLYLCATPATRKT